LLPGLSSDSAQPGFSGLDIITKIQPLVKLKLRLKPDFSVLILDGLTAESQAKKQKAASTIYFFSP
jgi:hypothetical protein